MKIARCAAAAAGLLLGLILADTAQAQKQGGTLRVWHRDSPGGSNVNALTSDRLTDMGGGSIFHTNLVQFEKA